MELTIRISQEEIALLRHEAKAAGMSEEQYARDLLRRQLSGAVIAEGEPQPLRSVTERILKRFKDLPGEPFESPRPDGASQHDHYIHGTVKRKDL